MDIAVLSDVHGNYIALKCCLEYAFSHNIGTFFFLGDYVGELAYPERTMEVLYDVNERYKCYFIKGNKEDYWLKYRTGGEKGWEDKNSASGSLLYTYKSLTSKDLDFFAQLQPVREITVGDMSPITICHGSPNNVNEKMLPDDDRTIEAMNSVKTSIILCGHSHIQRKIVHNEKCVLNPGAVGVPLLSEGKTQFLILHGNCEKWSEEFISLEYDVDRAIRDMHEVKLDEHAPYWSLLTKNILREGNTSHGKILSRAMDLCREETGDCVWPYIPERCWAQAVNELIYAKPESNKHYIIPKNPKEKLCMDILMTLLLPNLQNTVDNYYKEYLTVTPTVAPHDISVLSMNRIDENGTFGFCMKLKLHPYVGPHLDVGIDYITVRVNPVDEVKIEKFEHVKSYELPSYYQNIVKKKLP